MGTEFIDRMTADISDGNTVLAARLCLASVSNTPNAGCRYFLPGREIRRHRVEMGGIVVRPRAGILHGHDWVYLSEVLKVFGSPSDGDVVSVKDGKDRLLGTAIYNSKSQIVARRISRRRQELDREFFSRRIRQASDFRDRIGWPKGLRRVVWSESDGLPGVIVDQYEETAVLQTLTLAMDMRKGEIAAALIAELGVRGVVERNDAPVRAAEGMYPSAGILAGDPQTAIEVACGGVRLEVDLLSGQKTGLYLDQVESYAAVARHAPGRRVLDCFSNQGGFALACARAGAASVKAVEASAESVERLKANAKLNCVNVETIHLDVFDFLKQVRGEAFDLAVLDPPSFAKARSRAGDAIRGYRELHLRAAGLLAPSGILATFCCSHHVRDEEFLESIREGFHDAKRSARVLQPLRQSRDHPILLAMPETAYLKGYLLEVSPSR